MLLGSDFQINLGSSKLLQRLSMDGDKRNILEITCHLEKSDVKSANSVVRAFQSLLLFPPLVNLSKRIQSL
jgi:hypothetical protein